MSRFVSCFYRKPWAFGSRDGQRTFHGYWLSTCNRLLPISFFVRAGLYFTVWIVSLEDPNHPAIISSTIVCGSVACSSVAILGLETSLRPLEKRLMDSFGLYCAAGSLIYSWALVPSLYVLETTIARRPPPVAFLLCAFIAALIDSLHLSYYFWGRNYFLNSIEHKMYEPTQPKLLRCSTAFEMVDVSYGPLLTAYQSRASYRRPLELPSSSMNSSPRIAASKFRAESSRPPPMDQAETTANPTTAQISIHSPTHSPVRNVSSMIFQRLTGKGRGVLRSPFSRDSGL